MKVYGILLLTAFVFACSDMLAQVDRLFSKELTTQEKVYIQMDNNAYVQGDTVWYKAYVVRADNNCFSSLSRILYVELLDEQGYLQERQQIIVDFDGQANGQFALRKDAFPGHYEIRAYTKWMMNFYDGYFMSVQRLRDPVWVNGDDDEAFRCADYKDRYYGWTVTVDKLDRELQKEAARLKQAEKREKREKRNMYFDYRTALKTYKRQRTPFSRVFCVYKRPVADSLYRQKVMPTKVTMGDYEKVYLDKDLNVRFYPEGGHLVDGLECRVGWEIYDNEGQRLDIRGQLVERDSVVCDLKPFHAGRGTFVFRPSVKGKYEARFGVNGKNFVFPLPKVEKEGCSLQVTQEKGKVYFLVGRRFPDAHPLYMALTCRGKLVMQKPLEFDSLHCRVSVDKEQLPLGVNQVTVFDDAEQILADRLYFVRNSQLEKQQARVTVEYPRDSLPRPFGRQKLHVRITRPDGTPVAGQFFSLSVRDRDQLDHEYSRGNILTTFLLQSDVGTFVENPEYYFQTGAVCETALDQLLLIQGWRRYDWKKMAHAERFVTEFYPELTTTLTGRASNIHTNIFKKRYRGRFRLFCSIRLLGDRTDSITYFRGKMMTDSLGRFGITYPPFYGDARLTIRTSYDNRKTRKNRYIAHDKNLFIRKDYFFPLWLKPLDWYELNQPFLPEAVGTETVQDTRRVDYPSFLLPRVTVRTDKRQHLQRLKNSVVMRQSFFDLQNDFWDMGWYDSFNLFDNESTDIMYFLDRMREYIVHQNPSDWFGEQPEVITNWKNGAYQAAERPNFFTNINWIDSVEIVTDNSRCPSRTVYRHLDRKRLGPSGMNASSPLSMVIPPADNRVGRSATWGLSAYVNIVEGSSPDRFPYSGREWNLRGFEQPAAFYSPVYGPGGKKENDHRRTLYWNPSVVTDKNGEADVTFFNSAVCTDFDVEVEGITKDGCFFVYSE